LRRSNRFVESCVLHGRRIISDRQIQDLVRALRIRRGCPLHARGGVRDGDCSAGNRASVTTPKIRPVTFCAGEKLALGKKTNQNTKETQIKEMILLLITFSLSLELQLIWSDRTQCGR
jgi:hypothetical protein